MALPKLNYSEIMTALGRFIADKKMRDVCVMEFEDGIIVTGSVVYESRGGVHRSQETFVLAQSDLEKMAGSRAFLKG
jgi:hypothetical protein